MQFFSRDGETEALQILMIKSSCYASEVEMRDRGNEPIENLVAACLSL